MGCSKGANVTLQAMADPTTPTALPTNGDPANDSFPNANITPTGFAMGIQSATLTGTDGSSFTMFDQGTATPLFTRLYNSPTMVTFASSSKVSNGTYNQLALQVVYYEAAIQTWDNQDLSHTRRLRYYLGSATDPLINLAVTAGDLLLSSDDFIVPTSKNPTDVGSGGMNLAWISQVDGSFCSPRIDCSGANLNDPYQGNTSFLAGIFAASPIVSISPITIDSSTNATYLINLTFGIANQFFYDDTDGNNQFDSLSTLSNDGKIDLPCAHPYPACVTTDNPGSADFWIGPPQITATVISQ